MARSLSVFEQKTVQDIYQQIQEVYLSNSYPWVVGYSGGKDSTATLQLVWYAVRSLPAEKRTKPIYVISSDTLVENPSIALYLDATLTKINEAAVTQGLPIEARKVSPELEDTFWVKLIGYGYPAPSKRFRWCTERLKIMPANRFILSKVSEFGKVIVVLGSRRSESATRAQVMALHKIDGLGLSRHTTLPGALVFTPVEDFSADDVWQYLFQVQNPWGGNNRDLAALYQSAQAGECPLVIDTSTPSCGNSRFGCWVCTVVNHDKTMSSMIDNGDTWMEPLLEFRNLLAETQIPSVKLEVRDLKRRSGKVSYKKSDGTPIPGPYRFEFRKQLLEKLLQTQQRIREHDPSFEAIRLEEMVEIQRIWVLEANDWSRSAERIYERVTGNAITLYSDDLASTGENEDEVVTACAEEFGVSAEMLKRLLTSELEFSGMARRAGIFERLEGVLREEWRDNAEILAALEPPGDGV